MIRHKNKSNLAAAASLLIVSEIVSSSTLADDSYAIEEVTVTASKRTESLQNVALAITALSAEDLITSHISRSEDLGNLAPSLTFQRGGSDNGSSFNIRGIGTQSFSSGVEPSIATVIDGVVMGRSGMAFNELLDIQRIEVLRGPQGMLFGKNASGGVIHIITHDPSEDFEAELNANTTISGTQEHHISGVVSAPLSDTLGLRVALFTTERDGNIENVLTGKNINDRKNKGGRIKLKWQASENLDIKWSSDYSERNDECCQPQARTATPFKAPFLGPLAASTDNDRVNIGADVYNASKSWGHSFELNWDIGDYTLTSLTAYRDWNSSSNQDVDGTPLSLLDINAGQTAQNQSTQELRLSSPKDQTLNYVLGLYYFDQNVERGFERVYHDIFGLFVPQAPGLRLGSLYEAAVGSTSYAGFGQFEFNLSDDLRLLGGARYTRENLDFEFQREKSNLAFAPIAPNQALYQDKAKDTDWSFKVGAQWNISDEVMGYISFTEGYKGPAFNVVFEMTPENTRALAPETSDSFELGLKSEWFQQRLIINAALFQSDFDNFQAQAQDANTAAFTLLNAGEVRTRGFELDFMALATQKLKVSGGLAFVDAQIVDFTAGPCSPRQISANENSCSSNSQDLSGKDLPFSPELKLNLSAEYVFDISDNYEVTSRAAYRWQDEILYSMDQDHEKVQDGYGVLDLSLKLETANRHYSVTLFVDNVLDEHYVDAIVHSSVWSGAYEHYYSPNSERNIGLNLKYRW